MNQLKDQLIKIGKKEPTLRKHLKSVLDTITSNRSIRAKEDGLKKKIRKEFERSDLLINVDDSNSDPNYKWEVVGDLKKNDDVWLFMGLKNETIEGVVYLKGQSQKLMEMDLNQIDDSEKVIRKFLNIVKRKI